MNDQLIWKAKNATSMLWGIASQSPGDVTYLPRWIGTRLRGQTTLSARTPWFPYSAIDFLARVVSPQASVFEWGGGGSTLWFADHAARVTTVEHDRGWYGALEQATANLATSVWTPIVCEPDPVSRPDAGGILNGVGYSYSSALHPGTFEDYARAIDRFSDATFDVVLVDGRARQSCLAHGVPKVRPGGILILDDAERERYQAISSALTGWPRHDFTGLRPIDTELHTTRIGAAGRPDGRRGFKREPQAQNRSLRITPNS